MTDASEIRRRTGHPDLIDPETLDVDGIVVDMGIVGPGGAFGDGYSLVVQIDCDENDPTSGTSQVMPCEGIDEARAALAARRTELTATGPRY